MNTLLDRFADPEKVAAYAEGPPRFMPGFADMQIMAALLLAERAPADGRILVLGAGGGLELRAFARVQPGWRFHGVDPSAEILTLARRIAGEHMDRIALHQGYIDDAPPGPFDGAACLLTLHFLDAAKRLETLRQIHARLKPGAAFVAAHSSFERHGAGGEAWLDRYAAFALASGAEATQVSEARAAVSAHLNILSPTEDEALMAEAGFRDVSMFYAGFTWRGWVGYS